MTPSAFCFEHALYWHVLYFLISISKWEFNINLSSYFYDDKSDGIRCLMSESLKFVRQWNEYG